MWITTKIPPCSTTDHWACFSETKRTFESNLAQLGVEQVDLVLLHAPNCQSGQKCDEQACALNHIQWEFLEHAYKRNKARAIGVSNYCLSCLRCLLKGATVVPAVNQVHFQVGMGLDPEGLFSFCNEKMIMIQAYSPFGGDGHVLDGEAVQLVARRIHRPAASVAVR